MYRYLLWYTVYNWKKLFITFVMEPEGRTNYKKLHKSSFQKCYIKNTAVQNSHLSYDYIIYVVEQTCKVSSSNVNHKSYFIHKP